MLSLVFSLVYRFRGQSSALPSGFSVVQNAWSQLSSIYHHISPGAEVDLVLEYDNGRLFYKVFFKGFYIGDLHGAHRSDVRKGRVTFAQKEKFLPITILHVEPCGEVLHHAA